MSDQWFLTAASRWSIKWLSTDLLDRQRSLNSMIGWPKMLNFCKFFSGSSGWSGSWPGYTFRSDDVVDVPLIKKTEQLANKNQQPCPFGKNKGPVWYNIYHHLPVVKGVCEKTTSFFINQPMGIPGLRYTHPIRNLTRGGAVITTAPPSRQTILDHWTTGPVSQVFPRKQVPVRCHTAPSVVSDLILRMYLSSCPNRFWAPYMFRNEPIW